MYLIEIVAGLVSPYIKSLSKTLFEEFPSQAPMREVRVKETEDKYVAAVMLLEMIDRATPTSFLSACFKL